MKVIILSKGRADTISTHKLFDDYILVLHTEQEKEDYLKNPSISPEKVVVSNAPFGVANQRQWIQDNLVQEGEWYISLDDNIQAFQCVPEPYYSESELPVKTDTNMKGIFENVIKPEEFLELCKKLIEKGEKERIYYIGFGTTSNFFFRGKHFRNVGFVITKAFIAKNMGTTFFFEPQVKEDYAYTAENLLRFGKVLIDNYIYPVAGHYQKGGVGGYAQRLPKNIAASKLLIEKYPLLFNIVKRKGSEEGAEVRIRFTNLKQVEKWRTFMRLRK